MVTKFDGKACHPGGGRGNFNQQLFRKIYNNNKEIPLCRTVHKSE
jgi:hypothetical protein